MAKAARTTITVPNELKERMNAVEEPVNWSALACRAFEEKLGEIAKKKEVKDLTDVASRLRASKRKAAGTHYESGFEAGEKWAKSDAEASELRGLEEYRESITCGGRYKFENNFTTDRATYHLAIEVGERTLWMNSETYDEEVAIRQAEKIFKNDHSLMRNASYVRGFVEGALSIWDQVKDSI